MPAVTESTMVDSKGEVVTDFIDSVGTSSVSYTYTNTQTSLYIRNDSDVSITVTVNGSPTTVTRLSDTTITAEFTSFSIVAASDTAAFYARSLRGVPTNTTSTSQLNVISGTAASPSITAIADANTGIFFPASETIGVSTNGIEKMRIDSNGYVSIGATSAGAAKLRVEDASSAKIYSVRTGGSTLSIEGGSSAGFIKTITNHNLNLGANNTDYLTITNAGNVGIGVNPNVELHVKGTGEILRIETTAATGDNYIRFYAPSATTQGYVGYTSAANNNMSINQVLNSDLLIFTNNTERMRIQNSGGVIPSANNTYELGSATFRWSTIYAQNALNTSDARLKTDVEPSSLGLDFINQLNPVQYRWIEGGNSVERVQTGTETVEISPAIPAQPEVLDEDGNVIQEATQEVPAVTEERPVFETVVTPREGVRTHFGLIAQEVKSALPDGLDFAGWCLADKDDANSTQSLGYTQLISPMIKAIQELTAKVEALEAQLNGN